MSFLPDLLKGTGNQHWDLARVVGLYVVLIYSGLLISSHVRGVAFDAVAIGAGLAALLAGVAAFIWAKDTARTAAISQGKQDATAAGDAT